MASSSSSSSSSRRPMKHHVFLSFRGEDTRLNFTTHLLEALQLKGLDVFFDERNLKKGEPLSLALSNAIAASNLSIIILSADYASSKSCLAELSDIMDRNHTQQHIVLPVFYHVLPSDVQNLGGTFTKSFEEKEKECPGDKVKIWKDAFTKVGTLKGIHILDRPETVYIEYIVEYVMQKLMKHQVFLSFRDEDTGLNFTAHLSKALKDRGINVFSSKGEPFSEAISDSNLSIIVLSANYASSISCLAELSKIMDRKDNQGQIVLPIFYHVDPSHVRNLGGSFKASFEEHKSNRPLVEVKRWKSDFAEVGKLKGWHIEGGKFDRSNAEHIRNIVEYVIKELNRKSRGVSEELVGIDEQKKVILGLIEQQDSRVIGLWGPGGIGKTTLADVVFHEISPEFDSSFFFQNVREEIKNKGMKSTRNELLSKLLGDKIKIDTLTIPTIIRDRLSRKRVIVVLDDVDHLDQIDCMGIKHFGGGSKIIVSSRNRQVLKNGGADDKIHEVKKLNENDSLQLFATFAFKVLNPPDEFLELLYTFLRYAQGSPLALKVLGSKLYTKSREEWESEVERLKEYPKPEIYQILKSSFDGLDELEKNIFLDIACFFKWKYKEKVEEILSCMYKGAVCGISNLADRCLIDITPDGYISMHDMLEEMGKEIVQEESKNPGKRSRLWNTKDVYKVLKNNEGTKSIEGIKLDISQIDYLRLSHSVFDNMLNLRYINFYDGSRFHEMGFYHGRREGKRLHAGEFDSVSFPDELKYICWKYFPFRSISPSFNPKNLVVLKLQYGKMEQLWNEDNRQDLFNLREIDLSFCMKLRKLPILSGAINLTSLDCYYCQGLIELPCFDHLTSLETLCLRNCESLKKIPNLSGAINLKSLDCWGCEGLIELPCFDHLTSLETLNLDGCKNLKKIPNLLGAINLKSLDCGCCDGLIELPELPLYLRCLRADICSSLEKVSFSDQNLYQFDDVYLGFSNCSSLNQDSIKNIEANAVLRIQALAQNWSRDQRLKRDGKCPEFLCCFPGNEISSNEFEHQSTNSSLTLKIAPNSCGRSKFLAFAICLVLDLNLYCDFDIFNFYCEYLFTSASCEEFESKCEVSDEYLFTEGDHVFILFSKDMIIIDNDYKEASFEFYIKIANKRIKVKKCGVHLFYVDAESYAVSSATEIGPRDNTSLSNRDENFDTQEDANIGEAHDDSATEMRRFSYIAGEEGEAGRKRLKYSHSI